MNERMPIVFIAGKFRGENAWEVELNIREAENFAFEIASLGIGFICPHTNSRFFDGTLDDNFWLAMTQELLVRCDAMFLCPNWKESEGAIAEVELAKSLNMPVFESLEGLNNYVQQYFG